MVSTATPDGQSSPHGQLSEAMRRKLRDIPAVVSSSVLGSLLPLELAAIGSDGPTR